MDCLQTKKVSTKDMRDCVVLGGSSNPDLVRRICYYLDVRPVRVDSEIFSNGETRINIQDTVRDKQVFVVQSGCGEVNDMFMELLIMISACKAASAKSVTAVLPLFPYSRQLAANDAKVRAKRTPHFLMETRENTPHVEATPRVGDNHHRLPVPSSPLPQFPLPKSHVHERSPDTNAVAEDNSGYRNWIAQSGSLVASLLTSAGTDHVITLDLHDARYQGFFDIPVDNLYGRPLLEQYIRAIIPEYTDAVIVSPDAGGAKRATTIADSLSMRFALIHKDRRNNTTLLVGDVADKTAVIIDDLTDSGKTLLRAARVVKEQGARDVWALCSHGTLSGDAPIKLTRSAIDHFVTTNSVPQDRNLQFLGPKLHVVDISEVFAEAIRRIYNGESISMLFEHAMQVIPPPHELS